MTNEEKFDLDDLDSRPPKASIMSIVVTLGIPLFAGILFSLIIRFSVTRISDHHLIILILFALIFIAIICGVLTVYCAERIQRQSWSYYVFAPMYSSLLFSFGFCMTLFDKLLFYSSTVIIYFVFISTVSGFVIGIIFRLNNHFDGKGSVINQANFDLKSFIKWLWLCLKGLCLFVFGYLPFGVLSAYLVMLILDKGYEHGPMHLAFLVIYIWLLGGVSFITLLILDMSQNKNQDSMFRNIGFSLSGISVCIVIVYTIVIFVKL